MGRDDPNKEKNPFENALYKPGADSNKQKVKPNSQDPLYTLDPSFPTIPIPKQFLHESIQFQLFVSRSYSPPSASSSAPPVYILKVRSASISNADGNVDAVKNGVEGRASTVVTETRLLAEGQFLLRSRL